MDLEEIITKAREALEREEYSTALDWTVQALKINPLSIMSWVMRGKAYFGLEEFKNAIESFDLATDLDPENAVAWFNQGNAYTKLNEYEEAISCYNQATNLDPKYSAAWVNKGLCYNSLKKSKEAITCYNRATDLNPEFREAWYNKGNAYANLKESEEAISCYNRATDLNPGLTNAWFNKGNAYTALKKYEEAISCYNRATDLNPGLTDAWFNKGISYTNLKNYEEAISCYNRATDFHPEYSAAWYNKGNAYIELKKYKEAISCYNRATDLNPGLTDAWFNKGNAYTALKKYEEAVSCYNPATDLDPGLTDVWFYKGNAYIELKKYKEAISCCDRATGLDPRYSAAWFYKGLALISLNRSQESASCLRRAYMENPYGFNLIGMVRKYKEHLSDPMFVQRIFEDFPALRFFPGLNDYAKKINSEISDMVLFVEAINSNEFHLGQKEGLITKGKIFYYYGDAERSLRCFDHLDDLDDQDMGVKYYYIISLQALAKTDEAALILNYVSENFREWIEESEDKTYQKYYAAIILGLLENYQEALQLLEGPKEIFLPILYLKYWFERKLFRSEASKTLLSILMQEEKMLVKDYRGFLFPHTIGEIFVDEMTKVISPIQYHAISQEIWEPIQMVLKAAEETSGIPENDLPAVNARLKQFGDYYRSVPFLGGLKFKEEFLVNLNGFLKAKREEEFLERAKSHLRQVTSLKWRNYSLIDQEGVGQEECERALAERLEIMGNGYMEEYSDINQILIYFLLSKKLKPEAFFLLAAFTAFLTNIEKEIQRKKSLLNGIKKIVFVTKVASTVNVYTIGIVFTLSALFDVSVNELYNYGPDVLDAYLENLGLEQLTYVDFKMRYSEFISKEYDRLGTEEFEKVYSLKNIFEQASK